jgi:NTE family protein
MSHATVSPASPRTSSTPRIALVIGSGAVKCAAALGLWKVLAREGIEIDMLVGCSGGSIYAAIMSLGYDLETCERMTKTLWNKEITAKRDTGAMLRAIFPKWLGFDGQFGMVHDGAMNRALEVAFGDRTFADTKIPLSIVATDLATGHQVNISKGLVRDAVRASVALPYVFRPWKIDDQLLMDGCLSDPLPVDVAIREGASLILAMGFESAYPRRIRSATRFAFHVNSVYTNNLLRANYAFHNLAHHAEIIPVLPEFDENVGLFDTHKFPYVIEQGARAAEAQLPYLRQLLAARA